MAEQHRLQFTREEDRRGTLRRVYHRLVELLLPVQNPLTAPSFVEAVPIFRLLAHAHRRRW